MFRIAKTSLCWGDWGSAKDEKGRQGSLSLTLSMANFGMVSTTVVGVVGLGYLDRCGTLVDNVRYFINGALVLRRGVVPSAFGTGIVEYTCSLSRERQKGKCGKEELFRCYHIELIV